jgi:micrococcal nuclease
MFTYSVKVIRVVDGDTIEVMADLGFSVWIKITVRLYGINTPESRTANLEEKKRGIAAKERLHELIDGKTIILVSKEVDKYGRALGELFLTPQDSISINKQLIEEGHAKEYFGVGPKPI